LILESRRLQPSRSMRPLALLWFLLCLMAAGLSAAQQLPPPPTRYFNDYAHVVPADVALKLNQKLEDFEKATSSQIVVAVFDRLPPNPASKSLTVETARAWRVGGKAKNNGAVLFVFVQDHQNARLRSVTAWKERSPIRSASESSMSNRAKVRQGDFAGGLNRRRR